MPIDSFIGIHYNNITVKTETKTNRNKRHEKTVISSRKNNKSF